MKIVKIRQAVTFLLRLVRCQWRMLCRSGLYIQMYYITKNLFLQYVYVLKFEVKYVKETFKKIDPEPTASEIF